MLLAGDAFGNEDESTPETHTGLVGEDDRSEEASITAAEDDTDIEEPWTDWSPNRELLAAARTVPNPERFFQPHEDGTLVAIYSTKSDADALVAQQFFPKRVLAGAKWSPDSAFLLFTTSDIAGHSPDAYNAFFFSAFDRRFHQIDADTVIAKRIRFRPPNDAILHVSAKGVGGAAPEVDLMLPLSKTSFRIYDPPKLKKFRPIREAVLRNSDFSAGTANWEVANSTADTATDPVDSKNRVLSLKLIDGFGSIAQQLNLTLGISDLKLKFRMYSDAASAAQPVRIEAKCYGLGNGWSKIGETLLAKKGQWQSVSFPPFRVSAQTDATIKLELFGPDATVLLLDDFQASY